MESKETPVEPTTSTFEKNGISITVTNAVPEQIEKLKAALHAIDLSTSIDPE